MSESIDLSDAAVFRDLGKPIGAINEERLDRFQERYQSLLGDDRVAPFFYGTHYSSAGIVLWYMLRLAPFTGLAHSLQVLGHLFMLLPLHCAVLATNTDMDPVLIRSYRDRVCITKYMLASTSIATVRGECIVWLCSE